MFARLLTVLFSFFFAQVKLGHDKSLAMLGNQDTSLNISSLKDTWIARQNPKAQVVVGVAGVVPVTVGRTQPPGGIVPRAAPVDPVGTN